jgi:hypothetical protein
MPAPLFPAHDGPVFMRQGPIGDCYLLAALDCLLCADGGYALVKSLFTLMKDGVEVRLFYNGTSPNLTLANLGNKYYYRFDIEKQQDIFFLTQERMDEIDQSSDGVMTNSLAIKILERLLPYYFTSEWKHSAPKRVKSAEGIERSISIDAHHEESPFTVSVSKFMGSLFGMKSHDCSDIDLIIKIKELFPLQPIYIEINYLKKDAYGKDHVRHALRVDQISMTSSGESTHYSFLLINPWNNQKKEIFSYEAILQRNCRFSIFQTNPKQFEWITSLLQSPEMLKTLTQIKYKNSSFSPLDIDYCLLLFKQSVDLPAIFKSLLLSHQFALMAYMAEAKKDIGLHPIAEIVSKFSQKANELSQDSQRQVANTILNASVKKINQYTVSFKKIYSTDQIDELCRRSIETLQQLIQHDHQLKTVQTPGGQGNGTSHPRVLEALNTTTQVIHLAANEQRHLLNQAATIIFNCVQDIRAFPITWVQTQDEEDIDQQCVVLQNNLLSQIAQYPQLNEVLSRLGVTISNLDDIRGAYYEKVHIINQECNAEKERIVKYKEVMHYLERVNFLTHLSSIKAQMHITEILADLNDPYGRYVTDARNFYIRLNAAKDQFIFSTHPQEQSILEFNTHCMGILHSFRPLLEPLTKWKELLATLSTIVSPPKVAASFQLTPMNFFTPPFQWSHPINPQDVSQPPLIGASNN